jgi:hypothetical protein
VLVPVGSALAAGKAFDFRADVLLLLGGLLALFTHFIAPTVLHLEVSRKTRTILFSIGMALVAYGIVLTVIPRVWTPFAFKFAMPKIGWTGVFTMAIAFDLVAAALSILVLRRLKVPGLRAGAGTTAPSVAAAKMDDRA